MWPYVAVVAGFGIVTGCVLWGALATAHDQGWIDLSKR